MNKVAVIIVILAMVVGLGGCAAPRAPVASSEITVIELPTEAHFDEYITVKVKVPDYSPYELILIQQEGDVKTEWELGSAYPDDQHICSWYVPLVPKSVTFRPGSYLIAVGSEQSQAYLVRNIIIKE